MESVGKEIVFDVIERPNHPVTRGKERDPIANPKPEATQTNELERTSDVGPAIYRKHIILALRGARHFDAQGAACILREVRKNPALTTFPFEPPALPHCQRLPDRFPALRRSAS